MNFFIWSRFFPECSQNDFVKLDWNFQLCQVARHHSVMYMTLRIGQSPGVSWFYVTKDQMPRVRWNLFRMKLPLSVPEFVTLSFDWLWTLCTVFMQSTTIYIKYSAALAIFSTVLSGFCFETNYWIEISKTFSFFVFHGILMRNIRISICVSGNINQTHSHTRHKKARNSYVFWSQLDHFEHSLLSFTKLTLK